MRRPLGDQGTPAGAIRVSFQVEFNRGPRGQWRAVAPVKTKPAALEKPPIDPAAVPRITRMLVLAYHFERLVQEGKVKNYAEIARLTGLSRARISQICNLAFMPAKQQENALLPGSESFGKS